MLHTNTEVSTAVNQEYNGVVSEIVGYDDIQGSIASSPRKADAEAPVPMSYDYGIVDGVDFVGLGFDVGQGVYSTVQSPHSMQLSSVLEQHFHWVVPTSDSGKTFKFQLDVIGAGVFGTWKKPESSPFSFEVTLNGTENTKHNISELGEIEPLNTTVSSIWKLVFTRIESSGTEYPEPVLVEFLDGHFMQDQPRGSVSEYNKFA